MRPRLTAIVVAASGVLLAAVPTGAQVARYPEGRLRVGRGCGAGPSRHIVFSQQHRYRSFKNRDWSGWLLVGVDFHGSDLTRVTLQGAHLRSVNLSYASLRNADLTNASVVCCDLRHCDLRGARLRGVWYDQLTRWPAGFDPRPQGAQLKRWPWRRCLVPIPKAGPPVP